MDEKDIKWLSLCKKRWLVIIMVLNHLKLIVQERAYFTLGHIIESRHFVSSNHVPIEMGN